MKATLGGPSPTASVRQIECPACGARSAPDQFPVVWPGALPKSRECPACGSHIPQRDFSPVWDAQ